MDDVFDVLRLIEDAHNDAGWQADGDAQPGLWLLIENEAGDGLTAMDMQFAPEIWAGHVVDGLKRISFGFELVKADPAADPQPPGFVGAVIVTEGWALSAPADDTSTLDQNLAWAAERKIREHPERREVRTAQAVMLDGKRFAVHHWRDTDEVQNMDGGQGYVIEALAELVKVIGS